MSEQARSILPSLDVVSPTVEAVTLNAISGVLAQAFTAYKAKVCWRTMMNTVDFHLADRTQRQDLFAVDVVQIFQFMTFTAIVTAPNYLFQTLLENCFPTRTVPRETLKQLGEKDKTKGEELLREHGQLDIRNTIIKFVLDQSLSATTNTVLFIVVLGAIKGQSFEYIEASLYEVSDANYFGLGCRLMHSRISGRCC